jgi:phosphoglycerol transferase MdoB-like AlkP superfamily enzyme
MYKLPGQKDGEIFSDITKQIDIMPTILNLTDIKTNYPMFGRDVFGGSEVPCDCDLTDDDYYSEALIKYNLFDYFY